MKKILVFILLSFSVIANGKYSRAPSIDPDYPLVTEAFVPGVTLPNSNIPKFPKLTTPEELLSKAFEQIDQASNPNSNSDSLNSIRIHYSGGLLTSSEGSLTTRNKNTILGSDGQQRLKGNIEKNK